MLPRTQPDLNARLGIVNGQWANTTGVHDMTTDLPNLPRPTLAVPVEANGIHLVYTCSLSAEDEEHLGEFTNGLLSYLETSGLKPRKPANPAVRAAVQQASGGGNGQRSGNYQGNGGGGYRRGGGGNGYARPSDGFTCPVHGDQNIGPGYQNRGVECKVSTDNPDTDDPNFEWTKENPSKTGRFYCRFTSQNAGG